MKKRVRSCESARHTDTWLFFGAAIFLSLSVLTEIQHHLTETPDHLSAFLRVFAILPSVALLYWGAALRHRRCSNARALVTVTWIAFAFYLYLVINFTLLDAALGRWSGAVYQRAGERRSYYMEHFVNFRPFYSIWNVYIRGFFDGRVHAYYVALNLIGNLAVFTPLAFLLPFFFAVQRRWYVFLATMLLAVICVESLQLLLMLGSCDVDDLILNAGGAMIAYFVLRIRFLKKPIERLYRAASR